MIEELKKLAQIIYQRGVTEENLLDFISKKPKKEWKLFEALANGKVSSDQEAIALLYPKKNSTSGFRMLKLRLRKKLMNQLFFLDFQGQSFKGSHAVEQDCFAKLYQGKVLINSGAYEVALPLLKYVLATSEEYHFNDITYLCLRSLLHIYVNLGEKNEFNKTNERLQIVSFSLRADQESERLFLESTIELRSSVAARKSYLNKIEEILQEMEVLWKEAQTYDTFDNYYRITVWAQELKGDFNRIIEITNDFEELLKSNKLKIERFDQRFNKYIQVYAHLRVKKLEEGLKLAAIYEPAFNPSSNNWFSFMENYVILALHAKKYLVAHNLLEKILANPFFLKINKMAQERWHLFEAYLHFVDPVKDKPLKWQELVQNSLTYSKDKEGYNVAILILQVMHCLDNQDMETLEYRMEALKKYAHKHFKDSFSERSRTFFKLLGVMARTDFDPWDTTKKSYYLFQKLQRIIPPGDAYAEIEIIPYEHLWELIIEKLHALEKTRLHLKNMEKLKKDF